MRDEIDNKGHVLHVHSLSYNFMCEIFYISIYFNESLLLLKNIYFKDSGRLDLLLKRKKTTSVMAEVVVRPMNGGNGHYSYSKNSAFQVTILLKYLL